MHGIIFDHVSCDANLCDQSLQKVCDAKEKLVWYLYTDSQLDAVMRRSGSFLPFLLRTSYQLKKDGATITLQLLPIILQLHRRIQR